MDVMSLSVNNDLGYTYKSSLQQNKQDDNLLLREHISHDGVLRWLSDKILSNFWKSKSSI